MKNIHTLVEDIHGVVGKAEDIDSTAFSTNIANAYHRQIGVREARVRKSKSIYFSELGDVCLRRLWFKHHKPEAGEVIPPVTRIKFLYGDMLEEMVLQLARDAGHVVEGVQKEVEYVAGDWRIRGRIDAIIDGVVVDVKSVTKQSERKFHEMLVDDPFGYYGQLNGYACVLKNDDMGFLTIQKELGHVHYFPFSSDQSVFEHGVERAITALDKDAPTDTLIADVPQSATSKNRKLCSTCSYCSYKRECFPEMRAFVYSGKVDYLTKVVDTPRVPELDLTEGIVDE